MVRNVLRGLLLASLVLVLTASQGPRAEGVTNITRTAVIANDSSGISAMATQGGQKLFEDAFGKTIAVYVDGTGRIGVTYANSNPTIASSWATPVKSSAGVAGYSRPAAVLASSTSLRIITEGGSGAGHINDLPVTISRNAQNNIVGLSFGTRVSLDTSGEANYPSAVLAHNGNILAVWWQNATTSSIVKSFRWISGTGWGGFGGSSTTPDNAIVDTSDLDVISPTLIQRGDNRHVYLFGNRAESSPNRNLVFNKATFSGSNWSWGTQNLAYETGVARGPFDVPSAVWDAARQLVVVAHDISGFERYSVFTLTSSDVKTHIDTPTLAIDNNEWGNIEVHEPTGDYYIFMIDSVDQAVNHDNGRIGYIRYDGTSWESSLTIIDPDVQNVGISMRRAGSTLSMDFLYTDTSGGSPNQLKFVSTLQVENATTVVFTATEDASVIADQPTTNFGSALTLEVDSGPVAKHTFLRFQLTGLPSHQPIDARLRIFSDSASRASSDRGGDFYTTSNLWSESTVTWNNAPAANPGIIASLGAVSSGTWNEVDLTSTITGNGQLNIKIIPASSDGADYSSSEGTNPPELIIIFSNVPPVLSTIGNKSVSEETLLSFTVTATDGDNDPLTFSLAPGAPLGASITTSGVFSWTPTESQGPGSYQATVVVSDGALADNETITLTVNEVNRAPTITVPGPQLVQEGSILSFTVTATDPDIPANTNVFSGSGMPSGASLNPSTGVFSWTPTQAQGPGDYTISFTATDNGTPARSDTKSVAVHVNEPPVIGFIANQVVDEETLLSFKVNATDDDLPPQTLTYTLLAGAPAGSSIDLNTGMFAWTPTETQGPGTYSVTVSVSDGFGGSSTRTFSITVTEVNRPPVISVPSPQTLDEGGSVSFSVSSTDPDIPANALTLSASGLPSGAAFNTLTGLFSWTSTEAHGPGIYTITFTATDNGSPQLSDSKTVTITVNEVNQPPELAPIGPRTLNEETLLSLTATATDPDVPANTLTFSLGLGAPSGASITSGGAFSWTPSEIQGPGSYTITVIVSDGLLTDSETIAVTVNEANTPPVLNSIGPRTVDEQTTLTFNATATDGDVPVQSLSFSLTPAPTGFFPTGAVVTPQGAFSWTPDESQGPGSYTARFLVSDGVTSSFEDVTITVMEVNRPPVLAAIGSKTVNEETALSFTATATDPDFPANTLTYSLGPGAPAGAGIGPVNGIFSWMPSEGQGPGVYTVGITVSDGQAEDFEDVLVTVDEVNKSPIIDTIQDVSTGEETLFALTVNGSDPDIPVQTLTYSLTMGPNGSAINPSTGVFSWTPSEAQGPGTYTVTVSVVDQSGASAQQTFAITVLEVNQAPTLSVPGPQTVEEGSTLSFSITAIDPDTPANIVTLSASGLPSGASFNPATGLLTWNPSEVQGPGDYTVTFTAVDNGVPSLSDIENVTITVVERAEPPVLSTIGSKTVDEGTLLGFSAVATDPDVPPSPLTFSLGPGAPSGASIDPVTGAFTWAPSESQGPGTYVVRIIVSDGSFTDFEDVSVSVVEVNTVPTLVPVADVTASEGSTITFTVQSSDTDEPANTVTLSSSPLPAGASFNSTTGVFSWTPSEEQGPGQFTISFTATDNGAPPLSSTVNVTITVLESNLAPQLGSIGGKTVDEETLLTFNATATDADIPANTLTFSLGLGAPAGATITAGGVFTWTPSELDGPGTFSITVIVTDGNMTNSETITITVNEVNTAPSLTMVGGKTVDEGTNLQFNASATDLDVPVQALSFSLTTAPTGIYPSGATITPNGVFSWTPDESQGPGLYTLRLVVSDGVTTTFEDFAITVNEVNTPPILASIGNWTIDEETLLSINASANDGDLPANTLTFSLGPGSPAGTSIDPATGVFSWTPTESQGPGNYVVRFIVSDGSDSDFEDITITVGEVNMAPTMAPAGDFTVDEETLLTFTVQPGDPDIPANILTLSHTGLPAGAVFDPLTGIFRWTPVEAQGPGVYTVTFIVTDNGAPSLSSDMTVTVTVNEANQPPVLNTIGNWTVDEETGVSFTASASDADLPTNSLAFSLGLGAPAGTGIDSVTGIFTWTPTESQGPGTYSITITVTDSFGAYSSKSFLVTVNETNKPPALQVPGPQSVNEASQLTFTISALDPDIPANNITLSASGLPSGASFDPATRTFSWTPNPTQGPGEYTVFFTATDNVVPPFSDTRTVLITVVQVNTDPVLGPIGPKGVDEETLLTFNATAVDNDLPAQELTYSLVNSPPGATINPITGVFAWTPTEAQGPGTYTFEVRVTDSFLGVDSENITVTVNEVNLTPLLQTIGSKTVDEETLLSFTATATDPDIPATAVTFSLIGAPQGASINPDTGLFQWTPSEGQGNTIYSIEIRVTDNSELFDSETIAVTVREVNKPPVLNVPIDQTVGEGTSLTFTITATDLDLPAQTLTVSSITLPEGASFNPSTGEFSWTPNEAQGPGTYTAAFQVSDGSLLDNKNVTITVTEVNQPPSLNTIPDQTVNELSTLTVSPVASDGDLPAQPLAYSISGNATGSSVDPATGVVTWTPQEAQGPGTFVINVIVTDSYGGSVSQTFTIIVNEVNSEPVLSAPGPQTVNEGQLLTFTLSSTDPDVPANTVVYSTTGLPTGASFDNITGAFSWTPSADQGPGDYSVTFTATDNGIPALSDTKTVLIHVNEPPVLSLIGDRAANEETLLTFTANATDADQPPQALSFSLGLGAPLGTSITLDGVFSWTPSEDQGPGTYQVTIIVSDGLAIDSETITITVNEVNNAPVLAPIGSQTIDEETSLIFNATATDQDIPAQQLIFSLVPAPTGTFPDGATITAAGTFAWTPDEAQGPGTYSARIVVSDGLLADFEDIIINVDEVNRAPSLNVPAAQVVNEEALLTFTLTALDPDYPANTVTITPSNMPAGSIFDLGTGTFSWTPSAAQGPGDYLVSFTATDDGTPSMSDIRTVLIHVNEPPVLGTIGTKTVDEEVLLTFTATATDTDQPTQTLTFSLVNAPDGASIDPVTGLFTWTPSELQGPAVYIVRVNVNDGFATDFEDVMITVNEVNRNPVISPIGNKTVNENENLAFTVTAVDPDVPSNTVTLSASGLPLGATFDPTTGVFSWTPSEIQGPGQYTITFTASDDGVPSLSDSQTITVDVGEVTTPPNLEAIGNRVLDEETTLTFTANATDADFPANTLTFTLGPGAPSGAAITGDGVFSWTPSEQQGPNTYQITIMVSDGSQTDNETIAVMVGEVNRPPVLTVPPSQSIDEGTVFTFQLTATDPDDPSNIVSFSATGIPAGSTLNSVTGIFSWTPSEDQGPGQFTINFTVSDDGIPSLSDTKTVTITVNEVNVGPTLNPINPITVDEGVLVNFTATANDPDIPANVLSFSLDIGSPVGATINPATGVFEWTPTEEQGPGTYSVTVLVSDGTLEAPLTISIVVNEVNIAPTLDPVNDQTISEGATLDFTTTALDPDIPVQSLTFSLTDAPNGTFPFGASISQSGLFTWTPSEAQGPGTYQVRIVVSDGILADYQDVTITVEEVNEPPSLTLPGSQTIDEGSLLTFTVTAADPDLPANSITLTLSGLPTGASFDSATGVFSWTPSEDQGPGVYVLSFTATDNGTPQLSATGTVTITVNELNQAPVLNGIGDKTVDEQTSLIFNTTAFDIDVPAQLLSFNLNGAPAGTTITSDGVFSWTPTEEQGPGSYQFTITVSDGSLTDNETITVTVNEGNRPPALILVTSHTTPEQQLLTFTVATTDPDVPANTLTLSASNIPEGAFFDPLTGFFSWTPSESQGPGSYIVTFTVSDDGIPQLSTTDTVTITVSEVNTPPQISPIDDQIIDEETAVTFIATALDNDLPANTLVFSLDGNTPAGASIGPATGIFTWTPTEPQGPGIFVITVLVSDGVSTSSTSFSVTVNEVNNAPILEPIGNITLPEESLLQFTANASDVDLPAQQTSFSLIPAPNGTFPIGASISPAGLFTWAPTESQGFGTYTVRVSVSDGIFAVFEDVTIQVSEVNMAPSVSVPPSQTINEGTTLTFNVTATDPDVAANIITLSVSGLPGGATFDPGTGTFTWTPSDNQAPGDYTISFTATDDGNPILSDTKTLTIHVNEPPVLGAIGNQAEDEETLVTFTATATDTDQPAQTLVFSLSNAPTGAIIDPATGVFTWTPTEEQGPGLYQLTVIVSDGFASDLQDVSIEVLEVNRPPIINLQGSMTVDEETLLSFTVDTSDPDVPANNVSLSASGLPLGASFDQVTRVFSWTPSEAQGPGSYTVIFTATDNGAPALFANATLVITVIEVDQQPVLLPIGDQGVDEETLLTFTASASDPDVPANALVFSLGQGAPLGSSITVQGVFTWTPSEDQGFANHLITIIVSDGFLTDEETITVNVNEVNRAPSLVIENKYTIDEGSPFTLVVPATDQDIPSNGMTFSASNLPTGSVFDPLTRTLTWTPDESQGPGFYVISFTVTDDGTPALSETRSVTISVSEVNQAPALEPIGGRTINEETLLTFVAVATDADYPVNNLIFSLGNAPMGSSIDPASGVFNWIPSEAQGPGVYLVQVVVSDRALSDSETVEITVNEVNVAPQLETVADKTVDEETLLSFTVSASDSDIPSSQLTFTLGPGAPEGLSITPDGNVSWTPTEQQGPGAFSVTIVVSDGSMSDNQTMIITVAEVNTAPVLNVPGDQTIDEENPIVLSINATDADAPANALTLSAAGLPTGASFDPLTGVFSWTPSEAQGPGTYSITFTVTDDGIPNLEETLTLLITVRDVNQPPELAIIGSKTVDEETLLTFTALAADADVPPNGLSFSLGPGAPTGATIHAMTGVFTWTPSEVEGPGLYSVRIIVDDGQATDFEDVSINVLEVNRAPEVVVPGGQLVNEGAILSFLVTVLEYDIPMNNIALSASGLPQGAFFDPITGIFSWTPSNAQGPGDFTVTFTAVDDGSPSMTDSRTVLIHVNEAPVLGAVGNQTVDEETLLSLSASATDADLPQQTLTFTLPPESPAGASISPTGLFTWTPTEQQGPGSYSVTIIVSDGFANDSETINITVSEVNKAPSLAISGPLTVAIGTTQQLSVTAVDPDVPANGVNLSASGLISGMSFDPGTGNFLFTPDANKTGLSFTITFTATDEGSPSLGATQSVTVQVVSWILDDAFLFDWADYDNDGLVDVLDLSFIALCYDSVTGIGSGGCDPVSSVYWDIDQDGRTTIVDMATLAFLWRATMPSPFPGEGSPQGMMDQLWENNCSSLSSSHQSYCLTKLANDAPLLADLQNMIVDEGTLLTFTANATDPENSPVTFYLGPGTPEGASISPDGVFTWTPTEAQGPGNYNVTIIVSDGSLVDFETITITVNEIP